ncbi:hypothetical protein HDV00_010396 [Rhizophlyctis rosea]|nr:hypothetical protein HDV00_010396 [Rhizophlyctis rosea]
MKSSLLVHTNHRYVVGVDFGHANSGWAYAPAIQSDQRIESFYEWEDSPQQYCKTLTAFRYDDHYNPNSWGWTAYMQSLTQPNTHPCIRHFKLLLDPNYNTLTTAPNLPAGIDAIKVVADYLSCLRDHILRTLRSKFGDTVANEDILYVFTCPVWSDLGKNNLRQAAARAGYIPMADLMSSRLMIVTEPEAAALYVCKNGADIQHGETLMVIDAGGGTVDLTVQKVTKGPFGQTLAEAAQSSGKACGATLVDERFLAWLAEKVGQEAMLELKEQKNGTGYFNVLKTWESLKRQFRSPDAFETYHFAFPAQLYNLIDDAHMEALEEAQDGVGEEVWITTADMLSFFDPVVKDILELIENQLNKCEGKTCQKAFVVGGFSESQYLVGRIRQAFEGRVGSVISPAEPGAAIVKGAVLYGLNPRTITARRSRFTYGTLLAMPHTTYRSIDPNRPGNPSDIFTHDETGTPHVVTFVPVMVADQEIQIDDFYPLKLEPLYAHQTAAEVEILATPHKITKKTSYSDVPGLMSLGKANVANIPRMGDRTIQARIYFGTVELTVLTKVLGTGAEARAIMEFSTVAAG